MSQLTLLSRSAFPLTRPLAVILLASGMLALAACGSTKVYTADKTIVYGGSLYNMSNVQKISSRIDGQLAGGKTVNMRTLDRKGVEALLKENPGTVISAVVEMDGQQMVYQRSSVKGYSDYSKIAKRLDSALNEINKFMADKKKTQLKLK
jgi:hypothetical protein